MNIGLGVAIEIGLEGGVLEKVGVGVGSDTGGDVLTSTTIVFTELIPESPHKFNESLAYSRKLTVAPTSLFNVKVALPHSGFEWKSVQEELIHCPVLFVLKIYPPPDKLWVSIHKAEKIVVLPALVEAVEKFEAEGGVFMFQFSSQVEEASSIRVVV